MVGMISSTLLMSFSAIICRTWFAKNQPGYPNLGYGQMAVQYLKEVHGISYPKRDSKMSIGQ